MGSIRQYIRGNVARDRKRGSVHGEENGEKCDRCSSFLTGRVDREDAPGRLDHFDLGEMITLGIPPSRANLIPETLWKVVSVFNARVRT